MKKFLHGLLCVLFMMGCAHAQEKNASGKAPLGGMPPLIDRDLIFGNPDIAAAQLSPDGQYIAFLKPWKDTRNVYVKKVDEPFGAARLMTTETKRPVAGYFWSRDSKFILFVKDHDGDEKLRCAEW